MQTIRCGSSHVMEHMLAWRNPDGREEAWLGRSIYDVADRDPLVAKVITTELGLLLLIVTSLVELVAYCILTLFSLMLHCCDPNPFRCSARLLQSSAFTFVWACADMFVFNPRSENVCTHESFARREAGMTRVEDRNYIASRRGRVGAPHVGQVPGTVLIDVNPPHETQSSIRRGAKMLAELIIGKRSVEGGPLIGGTTPATQQAFVEQDHDIYSFVMTKAVYLYAFGDRRKDPIANFFQSTTRDNIQALRTENPTKDEITAYNRLFNNLELFNQEVKDIEEEKGGAVGGAEENAALKHQRDLFNTMKLGAGLEAVSGQLIRSCMPIAHSIVRKAQNQ